jgi:tetratricopeptide (TPR) repeat protein
MAKKNNDEPAADGASHDRLVTSAEDRTKAAKWFQRARELGEKRQFDYAIEYYVNGLEFWPDAVEEACKPLHGCAVARRQTGGKKPGLKDTMKRSMNDKDAKRGLLNAFWLFGRDPDNLSYLEGVTKNAFRLHAEDTAFWMAGVLHKGLESAPKTSAKQFQTLTQILEEMGDRAVERNEVPFAVELYQKGVDVLNLWRRRVPKDTVETAIKNMSSKLTITKGRYQKGESYRESIRDSEEQQDLHDEQRSVQSEDRVDVLIQKALSEHEIDPANAEKLKHLTDMLCRRERDDDETQAMGILIKAFQESQNYRWKLLADDIRMKQLGRKVRTAVKSGDQTAIKEYRTARLRFELGVFKERVERYPTDNRIKFELGVRNFQAGRFDDAIPIFQVARSDPRNRAACGAYLGRCFFRKGYHDQAIPILQDAIAAHDCSDDEMAKSLLYWLGRAEEAAGKTENARKTYGKILQLDYNYGDVRVRLDGLPPQE